MRTRKKVAVFVADMYGAMIRETQNGLNDAALEAGVKLIYFASFSDDFSRMAYDQYAKYDEGDIVSFELPDLKDFDAVVLISQSFPKMHAQRLDRILSKTGLPVINLGGKNPNYFSLINDDCKSFGDVVEHIVTVHGCKNIYHLAGPTDRFFTKERIDAFNEVLDRHGLPHEEDRFYYGNLWLNCASDALDYFIKKCEEKGQGPYPDAIVCANDYMAIGIVEACRDRGIDVPKDIIVTGYDGVETATLGYPSITTSVQPFYDFGHKSIEVLKMIWNGEHPDLVITAKGVMQCNQSCGCKPLDVNRGEEIRQVYSDRIAKMEYQAQSTTNMILGISASLSDEECFRAVEKNAMVDTGFKDFLLCLDQDWDRQAVIDENANMEEREMTVVAGFRGDKSVERMTFKKSALLPIDMLEDPNPYYIFSLHHLQYYMGYLIVSPDLGSYNQLTMKSWLVNLGAMLENWRIRRELRVAVNRLEDLYNRDVLTGLYNRRGYENFFEKLYNECRKNDTYMTVMIIDMDRLKYVNDNFGHAEGDYCICTIAEGMTHASSCGEYNLRTGGDEYVVLAGDYSKEQADEYITALREYIAGKIAADNKPYPLGFSVGMCIRRPVEDGGMSALELSEKYMKIADDAMYLEKKAHKDYRKIGGSDDTK